MPNNFGESFVKDVLTTYVILRHNNRLQEYFPYRLLNIKLVAERSHYPLFPHVVVAAGDNTQPTGSENP